MKTVLLAGGLGSRLGEETAVRPKPMVEIGGMPILWHIMKIYAAGGITDFIVCLGYKGYVIKEFFANYFLHTADVTVDLAKNALEIHHSRSEPWRITLVETGASTMTGGRLKAIQPYLTPGEPFCFTYGDGVADIDIAALIAFHRAHGRRATITSVAPPGRFGALEFDGDRVTNFREKPAGDGGLINGGFFVGDPSILDLVDGPDSIWETGPLETLARSTSASSSTAAARH
jgi:glucose-1-phosphate cytidylyltransferase